MELRSTASANDEMPGRFRKRDIHTVWISQLDIAYLHTSHGEASKTMKLMHAALSAAAVTYRQRIVTSVTQCVKAYTQALYPGVEIGASPDEVRDR
jgi:hypothetical protein